MSLRRITWYSMTLMVAAFMAMLTVVAFASPIPSATEIADASSIQLLAWAVVIEAAVIVSMAGVIIQAYRNRVAALEKQVEACRTCATELSQNVNRHGG